ncbi:DUF2304 domain-containing protein [Candidatus Woesearchaeota archaeon]|nr:DUF2304 domain-containing protein [Candidatus Woesearchaeota archaeon]
MAFAGVQLVGVLFALIMLYLTFLYYKRSSYSTKSFVLWIIIWCGFLLATFFPSSLYGLMEELNIERTVDLFVIGGFMFFTVIVFYMFSIIKSLERRIEELVRDVAVALPKKKVSPKKRKKKS